VSVAPIADFGFDGGFIANLARHDQGRAAKLQAAERHAEEHKKGIWRNREFALHVRAAAQRAEKRK
jgi:endonuclease YncB( thermonuclease family)